MKLLYTPILLLAASILNAQSYTPLLQPDNFWLIEHTEIVGGVMPNTTYVSFKAGIDSTINGVTYKNFSNNLIREDVASKKVYRYDKNSPNNECLLYDFDPQIGVEKAFCDFSVTIDSVTTIKIKNGDNRKKFFYSGTVDGEYYIEGIGSKNGLFNLSNATGPPYEFMACVKKGSVEMFGDNCDKALSVDNLLNSELVVYPNPSNNIVKINSDKNFDFKIIGSDGKILKRGLVIDGEISISNLKSATYILELKDTNEGSTKSILFQKE